MTSASGATTVVYNGEIYSHRELLARLSATGYRARGTSDTELLLEHVERFGLLETLPFLNGMFAFALFDHRSGDLWLVRDRLGVKPLYYAAKSGHVIFGSQLSAVVASGIVTPRISRQALGELLARGAIPAPLSIYEGVLQARPGFALRCTAAGIESHEYWTLADQVGEVMAPVGDSELIDEAELRLTKAVEDCLVADVPVGVLLSGGVDSSLVSALASTVSSDPVRTFSVGFEDPRYDETRFAEAVARELGTVHTTLTLRPDTLLGLVQGLPTVYDEPFADSSQLPTLALAREVRQHIPVVLNGDGGDESFAGYDRHVSGAAALTRLNTFPSLALRAGAAAVPAIPDGAWRALAHVSGVDVNQRAIQAKAGRIFAAALQDDAWSAYSELAGHWNAGRRLVLDGITTTLQPDSRHLAAAGQLPWAERIQYFDTLEYLPNDLLVKVDRATMSVGLEARVPLLDHTLVEWAWQLPRSAKIRDGKGKWLLREVLARHVSRSIIDRPKQGFAVPLDGWLRGPLRSWADELLDPSTLSRQGLFDAPAVRALWHQHLAGKDLGPRVWAVLMFQAWLSEHPEAGA